MHNQLTKAAQVYHSTEGIGEITAATQVLAERKKAWHSEVLYTIIFSVPETSRINQ